MSSHNEAKYPQGHPVTSTKSPEPLPMHVEATEKAAAYEKAIRLKMATDDLAWPEAKKAVDEEAAPKAKASIKVQ
jgi:hypothetical protein